MANQNASLAREISFLRFYRTLLQLLLPSFSELQWIAIAAMLFSELCIYRQPIVQLDTTSVLSTIYSIVTLLILFGFLFARFIPRKPLTGSEKFIISVSYYSFYAVFAVVVLYHTNATSNGWFQTVNHDITLVILALALLRGLVVAAVFKIANPLLELFVAERMNDRQYAPLALLATAAAVPLAIYLLQSSYQTYTAPAFLAVVYVSLAARVIELVWNNLVPAR